MSKAVNRDQQDCPGLFQVLPDEVEECGWTGRVTRYALDGLDTENGYSWTCPRCGTDWSWDGPDPVDWEGHPDLPVSEDELRRLIAEDERNR